MNILEQKIRAAKAAGRPALIPFLTAGFPDQASFWPAIMEGLWRDAQLAELFKEA